MSMFTLAISYLTTSSLPWFTDLTFQVPVQYCSSQHQTLLSPPDTSRTEHHFPLGSRLILSGAVSNCPPLFPVAYWTLPNLGGSSSVSYLFAFSDCPWGSRGKNARMSCPSLLQWTTFCQNSSLRAICLGWPCTARLIASLSYMSPFAMTGLLFTIFQELFHFLKFQN